MLREIPSSQGKRTDIETFSPVSEEVKQKPKVETSAKVEESKILTHITKFRMKGKTWFFRSGGKSKSQDRHPDKVTASAYPTGVQGTLRRRFMCTSIIAYFCENINYSDISRRYLEPYNIFSYHPIRKIPPALL